MDQNYKKDPAFQYNMSNTVQEQKAKTSLKRARRFMLEVKKLLLKNKNYF